MNVIISDCVFIGMDKTGSSTLRQIIIKLDGGQWKTFEAESQFDLPSDLLHLPVIGSIRNPLTWYPSYWAWYREERFRNQWKSTTINASASFEDWVRQNNDAMVVEFGRLYGPNARLVRMEQQTEDLIEILEDIRGPLPLHTLEIIQNAEIFNANPNPKPICSEEIRSLILKGARPIFEKYYPQEL